LKGFKRFRKVEEVERVDGSISILMLEEEKSCKFN